MSSEDMNYIVNNLRMIVSHMERISRLINDYGQLLAKEIVYPIQLPLFDPVSEMYKKTINTFNELAKNTDFGEIKVLKFDVMPKIEKVRPKVSLEVINMKVKGYYWYGEDVLALRVHVDLRNDVFIPIATKYGSTPIITLRDLISIAVVLGNEGFVEKIAEILSQVEKELAEMLDKLSSVFNAVRMIGFEVYKEDWRHLT